MRILISYFLGDHRCRFICAAQQFPCPFHPFFRHILRKGFLHILAENRTEIIGAHMNGARHAAQRQAVAGIVLVNIFQRSLQSA